MKRKALKLLSIVLSNVMIFGTVLPASAYNLDENHNSIESVEYQNTEDEDFNNSTNVFAQIGSEYKVTIPKVVVLSGASKDAAYFVKVEGDIAGYEKVSVIPEDNFKLSAKNKADETATVNQDKTVWTVHDFSTDANGLIQAKDITAGKWKGTFNFNINLESDDVSALPEEKVLGDLIIPDANEWKGQVLSDIYVMEVGDIGILEATNDGEDVSDALEITSSNEDVVKVENKQLKAINIGQTTITTVYEDKSFSAKIKVIEPETPAHTHTAGEAVRENEVAATCTSAGSYDEVIYCSICNIELSRIQKTGETALGHNYEEGVCTRCGNTLENLSVTATGFIGDYDGSAHSITVTSAGNTISYSTNGTTYTSTNPKYINAGTYTVYYKVSKNGYKTITGSEEIIINKIDAIINTEPAARTNLKYTGDVQQLIRSGSVSGGSFWYSLDNNTWTKDIPTATDIGTYTIYYKVIGDKNHNDIESKSINVNIAAAKISDMSLEKIQTIAKSGKTSEYGIKVGDQINIGDTRAEIVSIGSDYIEFMTIYNVVYSDTFPNTVKVNGNNTIYYNAKSSFYDGAQVNNGKTNTATVGYNGSNIQKQVNAWFNSQSDDFKKVVKNTSRTYETATLKYVNNKYYQNISGTKTVTEKVYIPTKSELENIFNNSTSWSTLRFWTATPSAFSEYTSHQCVFGGFYRSFKRQISATQGYETDGAVAMFRIG